MQHLTAKACCALLLLPLLAFAAEEDSDAVVKDLNRLIFDFELKEAAKPTPAPTATEALPPPGNGSAGPRPPRRNGSGIDDESRYQQRINEALEREGPYSARLREEYQSLGTMLQARGDHEKAIDAFKSALHINRLNEGLFTVSQIPMLREVIESYTALDNQEEVAAHHDYLYYLQQKAYPADSKELLQAKEEYADWNVQYFFLDGVRRNNGRTALNFSQVMTRGGQRVEYVAIQNPRNGQYSYVPSTDISRVFNTPNSMGGDLYSRSIGFSHLPEEIIDARLRRARELYQEIGKSANSAHAGERTEVLDYKLANIAYAVRRQMSAIEMQGDDNSLIANRWASSRDNNPVVQRDFYATRDKLRHKAEQLESNAEASAETKAQAWLDLADWEISYDRSRGGSDHYQKALDVLVKAGRSPTEISAFVNPKPLLPTPAYAIHPYTRTVLGLPENEPLAYIGYMDVTLTLTQQGVVRNSSIVGASTNTPLPIRRLLLDFLREQPMRPLVQNGSLVKESTLSLRVHYAL